MTERLSRELHAIREWLGAGELAAGLEKLRLLTARSDWIRMEHEGEYGVAKAEHHTPGITGRQGRIDG